MYSLVLTDTAAEDGDTKQDGLRDADGVPHRRIKPLHQPSDGFFVARLRQTIWTVDSEAVAV